MAHDELSELLKTQISLTEWLEQIQHKDLALLREEDGTKRPRLGIVNEIIGLPYDKPEYFEAAEIDPSLPRFKQLLSNRGDELCAFRLVPTKPGLPKLRNRGKSIKEAYEWFLEQAIEIADYRVEIVPHNEDCRWATIFIVNKHGIFGEIVSGGHHILTQGFYGSAKPHAFAYNYKTWKIVPANNEALDYLKELINYIHVTGKTKQAKLHAQLNSAFTHNYLKGYFETTDSTSGTWFIDYSLRLGELYDDVWPSLQPPVKSLLSGGNTGCSGLAAGPVRIVRASDLNDPSLHFAKGSILVCEVTSPDFVPLMQKAAAIITDQGGILSHAAIVARELGIPCIVGTGDATKRLADGQVVVVNADTATVT